MTARRRWLVTVTGAETIGYLVPSLAGILTTRAGWSEGERALAVIAAGFGEGFALGIGQAWALPVRVRALRFALLTSLGGGLVWALVMSMMQFADRLPTPIVIAWAVLAGLVGLASIGTAQWFELRHHVERARSWIAWTALAWLLALPMSFLPGPFVDATTPLAVHLALWAFAGSMMALVMAIVTWQGVRRLVNAEVAVLEVRDRGELRPHDIRWSDG